MAIRYPCGHLVLTINNRPKILWDVSASYTYNSKSIQGSFTISPSQRTNLIINHKMLDKKLDLGLIFNDIFHTDHNVVSRIMPISTNTSGISVRRSIL